MNAKFGSSLVCHITNKKTDTTEYENFTILSTLINHKRCWMVSEDSPVFELKAYVSTKFHMETRMKIYEQRSDVVRSGCNLKLNENGQFPVVN